MDKLYNLRGHTFVLEHLTEKTKHEFDEWMTTKKPYKNMQEKERKAALDEDYKIVKGLKRKSEKKEGAE